MPDKVTSSIAKVRPPRLKNPHWGGEGEDVADHGEELEMCAEGKGLDGRKVRFYVQHLEKSGEWTAYEEVDGEVRYRRDAFFSVRMCLEAVDILMGIAGSGGLYMTSGMQRLFRDAHAANAHVMFSPDLQGSLFGQHALGLAGPPPLM